MPGGYRLSETYPNMSCAKSTRTEMPLVVVRWSDMSSAPLVVVVVVAVVVSCNEMSPMPPVVL